MSDSAYTVVEYQYADRADLYGPSGVVAYALASDMAKQIARIANTAFAAGASSQADRVAKLEDALRDLLEDYASVKFSCGHHALSGSVLEHARALLEGGA